MSLNIRGIGEEPKVAWVQRLKHKHMFSFFGTQETHLLDFDSIDVKGCWGANEFGCDRVDAIGRSAGILNLWDSNIFNNI